MTIGSFRIIYNFTWWLILSRTVTTELLLKNLLFMEIEVEMNNERVESLNTGSNSGWSMIKPLADPPIVLSIEYSDTVFVTP